MLKRGGYGRDFGHRFGFLLEVTESEPGERRIWFQAVSVGELRAIEPLLKTLKEEENTWIAVTTTTSTAYKILQEELRDITDFRAYFPLDFWPVVRRVWKQIKPDVAVLTESELWPEHMHQADAFGTPLVLINARLSDRSFSRYSRYPTATAFASKYLKRVGASSHEDAERFQKIGVPAESVTITGNLKLDKDIQPRLTPEQIVSLKEEMGFPANALVWLGSSTWPGEEAMMAQIFSRLEKEFPRLRLLIVPRHAERKTDIEAELSAEAQVHFRSNGKRAADGTRIHIADTTGELSTLSQIADVAFIGKTMPPHREGQTPIECAILGIPSITGPEMINFRPIIEGLRNAGISFKAENDQEIETKLRVLLTNPEARAQIKTQAHTWHQANRGSLQKTLDLLKSA